MARPYGTEEAIVLASPNEAVAEYLIKRGESDPGPWFDSLSEDCEAALLERGDRLIDLRLAEYCYYSSTAHALFHRTHDDKALRALVLSNCRMAVGLAAAAYPECIFRGESQLREYLGSISNEEIWVLFGNPTLDDRFLENFLSLGSFWQAMPDQQRLMSLSALARNSKLHKAVDTADHADGWGWHMAGQPFHAAWRLVIALDVNAESARHLSQLYDRIAPYCLQREGILDALPRWVPQNDDEREEEGKDNGRGSLSSYQTIRRAAAAMLLQGYEVKQEQLLASGDNAIRGGAYLAGRFSPQEMKGAIERDGWIATASLMQNPNCWQTSEHRDALSDGVNVAAKATFTSAPELAYWEHRRWGKKFASEHPQWFDLEEVGLEPEDKPLTESSTGDLVRQVVKSSVFKSIGGKVDNLAQAQRINFWLLVVILAIQVFRR